MFKTLFPAVGPNKVIYLSTAGLLLLILSAYLGLAGFPFLLGMKIKASIALNNGTDSMKAFENLPTPLEFRIFVFNVTNADAVTQGEKPIVQEIGPYIYDEHRHKLDLHNVEGDKLAYKVEKTYFFNKVKSGNHKETDIVTLLNIPLLGTGYMVEEKFPMGLSFLNSALPYLFPNISGPFLRVAVGDILFSGIPISCDYETGPAMPVCRGIRSNLPPPIREIPGTKDFAFSIFQAVNGTPSGLFKVFRGNKNIYDLGRIVEYNNLTYLGMWDKNSTCAVLKGTDSSIIPPIKSYEDIYLYLPEVCLSLRAVYTGETDIYGIHVYQYESHPNNFASAAELKENACRCRKIEDIPKPVCLKSGAIDATACQGAPVILTPPHFLHSDPEYRAYPQGLKPDKYKHETRVLLEPRTGVPLAAFKRIQMNIFLRRLEGIEVLANVSEGLFPLVWVEEALADEMLDSFLPSLKELMKGVKIMQSVTWILFAMGILCISCSLIFYLKFKKISCFTDNQIVSNMSMANPGNPNGLDGKRTVYNIPIKTIQNENSLPQYSTAEMFPERNSTLKNNDNLYPS